MKKVLWIAVFAFGVFATAAAYASDPSIEAIGVLGGQNLYYIYMTMGMTSDNFEKGVQNADFSMNIAKDVIASVKRSRSSILKLIDRNILSGEDAQLGRQMIDAYDSLSSFANAFISVIETRNSETVKQLEKYKSSSWGKIQTILNLED